MHETLERLSCIGIVPVIAIDDAKKAVPLARALVRGGIPCAEVTFRTEEAEEAIRRIASEVPELLLGAGTVLTAEQAERAKSAGACFVVSPGFNPSVVSRCHELGLSVVPGCSCPSDMERALELGLEAVKFFPAEQAGGLDYIKAVSAPYGKLHFMPTGGIGPANLSNYLSFPKVFACGGSWMASKELIQAENYEKIEALCAEAVQLSLGFSFAHMGINTASEAQALGTAELFSEMFSFALKNGNSSVFAGPMVELTKKAGLGTHGHIGVATLSVERAVRYLSQKGVAVEEESFVRGADGLLKAAYLKNEIAGFAVHLVRK